MSKIYEVRSIALSDGKPHAWGASYTRAEAEALLAKRTGGKRKEWADKYHKDWSIEEIDTTGLFELPSAPPPRERFEARTKTIETGEGTWEKLDVEIVDKSGSIVASYERNYPSMFRTFEPFRQGDRMLALISEHYTSSTLIDLSTGEVIAAEEPSATGFCPVGFYVPDWWDIHDGSILPGSTGWRDSLELPRGEFGFVWGCIWGDDTSWKVQYLDLTKVGDGKIQRDDRFGYVELASHPDLDAKEFIDCSFYGGKCQVTFSVLESYDVESGKRASEAEDDDDDE